MIKIKGDTPDEKINNIERVLNRMSRKLHKTVVGVMPAIPVMLSVDEPKENGEILSCLLPAKGHITNVCMFVSKFDGSETIPFIASIKGPITGASFRFSTRKQLTIQEADLPVFAGDMLTLHTEAPDKVHGVWVAFLYQMGIKEAGKEKFVLEELLALEEDFNVEETI